MMKFARSIILIIVLLVTFFACATENEISKWPCDTILFNGKIVTVDNEFTIAQALAIGGGRFLKVGNDKEVLSLSGPDTKLIDLKGKMVTPGFIDAHPHMIHTGLDNIPLLWLTDVGSIEAIKKRIREKVKKTEPGEWIMTSEIGTAVNFFDLPDVLEEKRWPTRWDLDEVAPNNPVYIPTPWTFPSPAIFNSAALTLLGIDKNTSVKDEGIEIVIDPKTGEPNGQIHGMHFYNINSYLMKLSDMLPKPSLAEKVAATKEIIHDWNTHGVTAVYECHNLDYGHLIPVKELWSSDELSMRIQYAYEISAWKPKEELDEWMKTMSFGSGAGFGDDLLKIGGVTLSIDGATAFGTSLMNNPSFDALGNPGNAKLSVSKEKMKEIAIMAAENNIRMNICFGGDKAGDIALQVYDEVNKEIPIVDRRWVVQHISFPSKEDIIKCKELGLAATTSSTFDYEKSKEEFNILFGEYGEYYADKYAPFRWWLDEDIKIAQSTDGIHPQPMFTIWQSLKRTNIFGESHMAPSKKISREEALKVHTINAAWVMFLEDKIGSIEEGKLADLVVLDNDILECPLDEIKDTNVLITMLGGKIVFEKE